MKHGGRPGSQDIRSKIAASRGARLAALPLRMRAVGKYDATVLRRSLNWLATSKEHTNYTYDLTELNWQHLAWWVAEVAGVSIDEARTAVDEGRSDMQLRDHVRILTLESSRRGLADADVHLGRRIGWYALVRILRPEHVVETGTDKGLGSVTIAQAIRRNGSGKLTTLDVNEHAGYLIQGYEDTVELVVADSVEWLNGLEEPVELFIHDSLHSREHEISELRAVERRLSPNATVLSDNSHVTDALSTWAEGRGWRFLFFAETPKDHWYPGGGIGAAWYS